MKEKLKYWILVLLTSTIVFAQTTAIDVTAIAKVGQQSATFTVTADGTMPFTYQWRKDGSNISGATSNPLVISNITLGAAGAYSVVVSNSVGSTTSNLAVLKVMSPPVFTTQPTSVATTIGKSVTLTAVASAVPSPTYQWFKNGTAISGATNSTFTISVPALADSGTYTCVATSVLDTLTESVTSNAATVTVNAVPPTITNISITIK